MVAGLWGCPHLGTVLLRGATAVYMAFLLGVPSSPGCGSRDSAVPPAHVPTPLCPPFVVFEAPTWELLPALGGSVLGGPWGYGARSPHGCAEAAGFGPAAALSAGHVQEGSGLFLGVFVRFLCP